MKTLAILAAIALTTGSAQAASQRCNVTQNSELLVKADPCQIAPVAGGGLKMTFDSTTAYYLFVPVDMRGYYAVIVHGAHDRRMPWASERLVHKVPEHKSCMESEDEADKYCLIEANGGK